MHIMHQAEIDYTSLRDALQQGDFQLADDLTRAALIELAGPDAEKRNWVYFSEVKFISNTDLQTIDKLWRTASKQRYRHSLSSALLQIVSGVCMTCPKLSAFADMLAPTQARSSHTVLCQVTILPCTHVKYRILLPDGTMNYVIQAGVQCPKRDVDAKSQAMDKVFQAN